MAIVKASFINVDEKVKSEIPVMFNPQQLTLSKNNNFTESNTLDSSMQFTYQSIGTMNLTLFLDTTKDGDDVQVQAYRIIRLANILDSNLGRPPKLLFIWGNISFSCVITSISQTYSHFSKCGWPLRAELTVSLMGWDNFDTSSKGGQAAGGKTDSGVTVKQSQTLQSISKDSYGDPKEWRKVAAANKVENPLRVPPGQKINVPGK